MRKLIKFMIALLVISTFGYSADAYDQTFPSIKLRHGYTYNFSDRFNNGSKKVKILSAYGRINEMGDYNNSGGPSFGVTSWLTNHYHWILNPYESGTVLKTTSTYNVVKHPVVRRSNNVSVVYTIKYRQRDPDGVVRNHTHTEYQPYEITWCGDGIKDAGYETCDPADTSKSGWGTGGCSNSCQPITAATPPVCKNLTVPAPLSVTAPATKNVSCTAANATTIKIDCGNGQTQSFPGNKNGNKTVSKTCNYTSARTYTPRCLVNNTITNNSCTKTVYVAPVFVPKTPRISIIKTDANATGDSDRSVGNDTQTVAQGASAVFRITVRNTGTDNLRNVVVNDPQAPQCNKTIGNLAVGQPHTYTCSKGNTQGSYTNTANVTGIGVQSGGHVNDTDPTRVLVVIPTCTNLVATPNSGTVSFNSNLSCTGNNVDSYKIVVKNSAGSVVKTINSNTGTYNFTAAGNYTASCYVNNKTTTAQACIKPIIARPAPVPSITVDKTDANPTYDIDNGLADTQTVNKGDKARFKIRVTNNGTEDLKNIVLTDAKAANCAGSVTLPNTKPSSFSGFNIGGAGSHNDSYLQPGEYFEYYCEKANTTVDYTNTVDVAAKGKTSNTPVVANDPTDIKVVETMCTGLTVSKASGDVAFVSNFNCTGNNVNTYRMEVTNASGSVLSTMNSNVGQYNFTEAGTYTVSCYMNDETTTTDVCRKTITANENTNPSIKITKLDANTTGDSDGQIGNDTQTVVTGEKAVFRIIVENNGTEDLDTIVLTDVIAPNCAGSVTLPNTKPSTFTSFTTSGAGNHSDAILQPGEIFEYTCEKANTTTDYTNSATVNAKSTKDDIPVDATDTTVVATGIYDLALVKTVLNKKDSYKKDDVLEFEIAVHNQGTIDATDVVVTDYIPTGLALHDVSWTLLGNKATRTIGNISAGQIKTVTITFKVTATEGTLINWAEISGTGDLYTDIDSTPDSDNENDCHGGKDRTEIDPASDDRLDGKGDTNGNGTCEAGEDEDDHDPASINVTPNSPSIKIEKYSKNDADSDGNTTHSEATDDTQTVVSGAKAVFEIKVTNDGDEDLVDVAVTDALAPECNKTIGALAVGAIHTYTCEKANTTANYVNVAKVDGKGKTSATPVTDEDDTAIILPGTTTGPAIEVIKYSNQGASDLDGNQDKNPADDNQKITKGSTAKFNIVVKNTGDEPLKNIVVTDVIAPNCAKDFGTLVLQPGESTPVYSCELANTQSGYTNTAAVTAKGVTSNTDVNDNDISTVQIKTSGGGGGGGSSPKCYNIEQSSNEYTCTVNKKTWKSGTVGIACNGIDFDQVATRNSGLSKNSKGKYVATFTCDPSVIDPAKLPKCDVQNGTVNANQTGWGTTPTQCKIQTTKVCGNGKVEPSIGEECDGGARCTSTCKLKSKGGGNGTPTCSNSFSYYNSHKSECDSMSTYPSGGEVSITTVSNFVIGGQNVFKYTGDKYEFNSDQFAGQYLQMENIGEEAINLQDYLCVKDMGSLVDSNNTSIISGSDLLCNGNGSNSKIGWIYPGETRYYRTQNLDTLKGQPNNLTAGYTSETNKLVLTIKDGTTGETFEWSPILSGDMFITVAKPTIANRGGGLAYINDSANDSNVSKIAKAVEDNNSGINATINTDQANFVATVLGSGSNLSYVDTLNGVLATEAGDEADIVSVNSTVIDTSSMAASTDFATYNGLSNVFAKKGAISLANVPSIGTDISKTFIIENGDLTITADIVSNKNIAFIVKNGDIIIESGVEDITGTYISIGGEIKSETSDKKLTVNGSLYGDLTNLTANRTHISMDSDGNINVGTVISYGSNLLNKPAPLVGQFINESIKAQKIAQ